MGIYIFGAGGLGREALCIARAIDDRYQQESDASFVVDNAHWSQPEIMGARCIRRSEWINDGPVVVAIGDSGYRRATVESLGGVEYTSLVHPSAVIMESTIGAGAIICAGAVITCASLGDHVHVNAGSVIGHDAKLADFVTVLPRAVVSGWCEIGRGATLGANSSVRDRVNVAAGAFVGMGAAVVRSITEPGTYVGVPAKKL